MQHLQWWTDFVAWQVDALPMVLVTVVRADGSTPREVGATMLLRFNSQQQWQQSDTIGGGHLEFQAIDIAKAMLKETETCVRRIERFNLSARLGQCCGGVMWLLFEKISPAEIASDLSGSLQAWRAGKHIWRNVSHQYASTWQTMDREQQPSFEFDSDSSEQWQFSQQIQPYAMQVLICGAGHVGEAIVRCLLPIGIRVKWIDPRDDIFPSDLLEQVQCLTCLLYTSLQTYVQTGSNLDKGWRVGMGPTLGCMNQWFERFNSVVQIELPYWEDQNQWNLRVNTQWQYLINRNNAVRLNWDYEQQNHQDWMKSSLGYVWFF